MELLDDVASNILYEEGGNKDAFWEKTSADYFAGLALGLFEDAKEEEVNINSISVMTTIGEEKFGARSSYIKEYFNSKDPASAAYTCASGTVMAAEETKASILSTFKQKIRLFASRENLSEMLATSDFDMTKIGKEKTAVFMIIQDEKKTYHALATIFVKQCYETLIGTAQETSTGALPIRTNFILDEFQNMPPLKDITTMVAAARSRHIRLTMIIQNFAGLEATYGKEVAQTIRSNCNNLVYLLTTELAALEEISKLCGEKKSKKDDKTASTPLITVSELQLMKENEAIVIKTRTRPFKTKLKPNWKIDWGTAKYPADEFVTRIKQPIHTFDLKSFVQEQQKNKFMGMLDNNTSNPFGGMVGNPFMEQTSSVPKESFNVDELVKKIDEKIAELEEEEKLEKEKAQQKLPKEKQTLFFSATMPDSIISLTKSLLKNPVKIYITPKSSTVDSIKQVVYFVEKKEKSQLLISILSKAEDQSVLIFSRTKHNADKIVKILGKAGIGSQAIHGNKSQAARQSALGNFKSGKTRVMVATDIASRGIDINELPLVINYDLPDVPETYVHRIGRTGRAGNMGTALTFCSQEERKLVNDIQKLTGKKLNKADFTI